MLLERYVWKSVRKFQRVSNRLKVAPVNYRSLYVLDAQYLAKGDTYIMYSYFFNLIEPVREYARSGVLSQSRGKQCSARQGARRKHGRRAVACVGSMKLSIGCVKTTGTDFRWMAW